MVMYDENSKRFQIHMLNTLNAIHQQKLRNQIPIDLLLHLELFERKHLFQTNQFDNMFQYFSLHLIAIYRIIYKTTKIYEKNKKKFLT